MHYLITGHTGFKGAWLTLWLTSLGHKVSGISLDPIPGALFETAKLAELVENDLRIDIRRATETSDAIKNLAPDVVFHMAAQPLVRESYRDPRGTIETNVMGTLNVVEAVSATPSVKAQVVVTTDKVYRNINQVAGYVESDPLGGDDLYSASKAMADILTHSWITSFDSPPTTIVRAGNVIGGGDVSRERLVPDLVRGVLNREKVEVRFPKAIRPWQHVLDCINGYHLISEALIANKSHETLNIGPKNEYLLSVEDVIQKFIELTNSELDLVFADNKEFHEAETLSLNSDLIRTTLGWFDKLSLDKIFEWTIDWYNKVNLGVNPREVTLSQIKKFKNLN